MNEGGGGNGGVTVASAINSNTPWYNEQAVRLNNTGAITALSVTIVIQRTTGVGFNGQFNTVGGQILQSNTVTASTITYQFTLASGQTLGPGTIEPSRLRRVGMGHSILPPAIPGSSAIPPAGLLSPSPYLLSNAARGGTEHCSLSIVHRSFVIVERHAFDNDK